MSPLTGTKAHSPHPAVAGPFLGGIPSSPATGTGKWSGVMHCLSTEAWKVFRILTEDHEPQGATRPAGSGCKNFRSPKKRSLNLSKISTFTHH